MEQHSVGLLAERIVSASAGKQQSQYPERLAEAFRLVCLRDTYAYARSECAFYESYPDMEIRRLSDLERLPVLERCDLERGLRQLCAAGHAADTYCATSGTTSGASLYVPRSRAEVAAVRKYYGASFAAETMSLKRTGVTLRLLPAGRLIPGGAGDKGDVMFVFQNNMARDNLWDNWDTLLAQMFASYPTESGFLPIDTIHATPPYALELLTRTMQQRGLDPASTSVRQLIGTGAHFGTTRRLRLCQAWSAEYMTTYSCAELNHTARECPVRPKTYHFDAVTHVEVVDETSHRHVGVNGEGRVLLTGLFPFHQASMLIRYAVGDWARWLGDGPCACGALAPTIELLGREKDCLALSLRHGKRLRLPSAPTLEALEQFPFVPAIPRPQFRWDDKEAASGLLRLHVECFALGSASWCRAQGEAIREAVLAQLPALAAEVAENDVELEVTLHPRSALSLSLPAR